MRIIGCYIKDPTNIASKSASSRLQAKGSAFTMRGTKIRFNISMFTIHVYYYIYSYIFSY